MAEITVRGAGIFGLSIAWVLAERGARVQVVDPQGTGAGSSGGIVGALAPHVPENWNAKKAYQLESLLLAESFWHGIQQAGGKSPGYAQHGRLQPLPDDRAIELARARAKGAETLWQGHAYWSVVEADPSKRLQPRSATGKYIFDTLSARLHPRQACHALEAALKAIGVSVLNDAKDSEIVVWATGWRGLQDLTAELDANVGMGVKGQSLSLEFDAPDTPQLFVDGLHIIPHANGTVAIGSTSERVFGDATSTDAQCDALLQRAIQALPELADAPVVERWAGVRPRARTRAPMLGPWPQRVGHFIANGGFKIGFGMAPKVAHTMADLIIDGADAIPDGFRVTDNL